MKAYEVPWMAPLKNQLNLLYEIYGTRGFVSKLYSYILENMYPPLTINSAWQADIPDLAPSFDRDSVWDMMMHASKNLVHEQIHLNYIQRTYNSTA